MKDKRVNLATYIGQPRVKTLLLPEIKAAKQGRTPMRHSLLEGPLGVGKTELAHAISTELQGSLVEIPEPSRLTTRAVTEFLLALSWSEIKAGRYTRQGAPTPTARPIVLFMDEVHRLPSFEVWYDVLTSFHVTLNNRRSWIPYFTFIGATTCPEKLPAPFVSRLPLRHRLQRYSVAELQKIILVHVPNCNKTIVHAAAQRARGVARVAIDYAKSAMNFGGVGYFDAAEIDERGLTSLDRDYLSALEGFTRPVGIATLAARVQCDVATLQGTVEPFLISLGLMEVTERGRASTLGGLGVR